MAAFFVLLGGAASGFSLQQPSLSPGRSVARVQQQATLLRSLRMQEETPKEEAVPEVPAASAAAVDFTPKPVVEAKEEFDLSEVLSKYSITISIFFVFCVVKALSYFGIVDLDD